MTRQQQSSTTTTMTIMTTTTRSRTWSSSSSSSPPLLLTTVLLLLLLLLQPTVITICRAETTAVPDEDVFFRERNSSSSSDMDGEFSATISAVLPSDCYKRHRLRSSYHVDNDDNDDDTTYNNYNNSTDASSYYRLTVDLPKSLSRKNLNVDIDYQEGVIAIVGWWMEQKVRGERPKKTCWYQEFVVDMDRLEQRQRQYQQQQQFMDSAESAPSNHNEWSLYDLIMELQGQQLALLMPKPPIALMAEDADRQQQQQQQQTASENNAMTHTSSTYVVARNLWKMVRGLARLNSSLNNSTVWLLQDDDDDDNNNDDMETLLFGSIRRATTPKFNTSSSSSAAAMTYLRAKQAALERFLRFSLGGTEEETYWLKHM